MNTERAATPPLDEYNIAHEFNNYTKKSRHGHGKDVVDENDVRQVAGCVPIDVQNQRVLLISSRKNKDAWVLVMCKKEKEKDMTDDRIAKGRLGTRRNSATCRSKRNLGRSRYQGHHCQTTRCVWRTNKQKETSKGPSLDIWDAHWRSRQKVSREKEEREKMGKWFEKEFFDH